MRALHPDFLDWVDKLARRYFPKDLSNDGSVDEFDLVSDCHVRLLEWILRSPEILFEENFHDGRLALMVKKIAENLGYDYARKDKVRRRRKVFGLNTRTREADQQIERYPKELQIDPERYDFHRYNVRKEYSRVGRMIINRFNQIIQSPSKSRTILAVLTCHSRQLAHDTGLPGHLLLIKLILLRSAHLPQNIIESLKETFPHEPYTNIHGLRSSLRKRFEGFIANHKQTEWLKDMLHNFFHS